MYQECTKMAEQPVKKFRSSTNAGMILKVNNLERDYKSDCNDKSNKVFPILSSKSDDTQSLQYKYGRHYETNPCCMPIEPELWSILYLKDSTLATNRNAKMMSRHQELNASNRAALLDWIMQMCNLYKVSRESYYLTLDYLDRFLSRATGIKKNEIQLVGMTCLFIACKVEEVTAITLKKLVKIFDTLYTEEDVLQMEKKILETIEWQTSIWTVNKWLFVYIHELKHTIKPHEYMQLTGLLDTATLDIDSLKFSYSVLAATCLYIALSINLGLSEHPQLSQSCVCECTVWMEQFWIVAKLKPIVNPPTPSTLIIPERYRCSKLNYSILQLYDNFLHHYEESKMKNNCDHVDC